MLQAGGFPLAPCTPSVSTTETNRQVNGDGKAHSRAVVGASCAPPGRDFLTAELPRADVGTVLSSGQPISTARTAARCICRLLYPQSYSEKNERAFRAASPVPALELAKARENILIAALPPLPAAQPHHPFCSVPFSPAGTSVCFSSSFFPNSSSISRSFWGRGTPQRPKFSKRERASLLM